jgi:hypothetical protein
MSHGRPAASPAPAVAAGHVESDGVAEHVRERVIGGDPLAPFADRDHELDLMMQFIGDRRERECASARHNCDGHFMKKNGSSRSGSWPISTACSA